MSGAWLIAAHELRRAHARRRLFAINVLVPLVLVAPIAWGAAPPWHAAAVFAVLFALFGTFGAAIPLLRDAERGWLARLAGTALDAHDHLVGRALAGAFLDAVQLTPAMLLIALAARAWAHLPALWLVSAAALLFGNLLGTWIAALARSVAEGALFAAVATLLLLHASGVFRTPSPGSIGATLERFAPFRPLHDALSAVTAGVPAPDAAPLLASSLVIAATAVILTVALAQRLLSTLAGAARNA